jgi:hypothetical protein
VREDDRVRAAGVSVRSRRFGGQIHGFITMGKVVPEATILIGEIAAVLDWAFQTPCEQIVAMTVSIERIVIGSRMQLLRAVSL